MKKDIVFDIGEVGKIKGRISVKQHSSQSFAAMVVFEYSENLDPRLKKLLLYAQCPHMSSTMQEAMTKAYESTKALLKRPLDSLKGFDS